MLGNTKTESAALGGGGDGVVDAVEALEDAAAVFLRNPRPGIGNRDKVAAGREGEFHG